MDEANPSNVGSTEQARPRKNLWESIITITPVILTVLATLLAGLSNSEMTQAQYYRSLAAQHQSKAGDQWGFFQAKRIRGAALEQTVDLLHAGDDPLSQVLPWGIKQMGKRFQEIEEYLITMGNDPNKTAVDKARQEIQEKMKELATLQQKMTERLNSSKTGEALTWLERKSLPEPGTKPKNRPALQAVRQAIASRKPDEEILELLPQVREEDLREAIDEAETRAQTFDDLTKPLARTIEDIGPIVDQAVAMANEVYRQVQDLQTKAGTTSSLRAAEKARAVAREMRDNYKAGQHTFKARCYEREARQNQEVAELYEVQVRLSSAASDRHRTRSKHFFYGMLAAQAGVTIASLALAVRRKSVLWSLASVAGVSAILLSGYVYLYM